MATRQFTPADCLTFVERSPAAVALHNKAAWLSLFAPYNIVEDPVGSRPHLSGVYDRREGHRGMGPLARFYETFIAPNDICFLVERDVVNGMQVVRDLTIEIAMSGSVTVRTPMHLLYQLVEQDGELKIFRLAAHWELLPMLRQQMSAGGGSLWLGARLGWRMLRQLGVGGTLGFMGALSGIGRRGKERVRTFQHAFNEGRGKDLRELFGHEDVAVELSGTDGELRALSVEQLAAQGGQLGFEKLIAAGNVVSASLCYRLHDSEREGVAFFEFDRRSRRIVALALHLQA